MVMLKHIPLSFDFSVEMRTYVLIGVSQDAQSEFILGLVLACDEDLTNEYCYTNNSYSFSKKLM